uniref:NOPS domain-containing protein n=1 Tax=Glossina pallidipes TaxID=7398 RepID=A0A1A9ZQS5_GLOPL
MQPLRIVPSNSRLARSALIQFKLDYHANPIIINDRGKTTSEGPCVVESFEANDDTDGLPEKSLNKKAPEFNQERSVGPRFAVLGSFEHEYGTRWKQLHELFKSKQEALKRELNGMEEEKLEAQMEYARYEHETELLRQELRKRESDSERKKMEWEMREKQAEEMRKREQEQMRRTQNEMQSRMMRQEEEMRQHQQEGGFSGNCSNFDNFGGAGADGNNNSSPFDFRGNNNSGGGGNDPNGPNGPSNQHSLVRTSLTQFVLKLSKCSKKLYVVIKVVHNRIKI